MSDLTSGILVLSEDSYSSLIVNKLKKKGILFEAGNVDTEVLHSHSEVLCSHEKLIPGKYRWYFRNKRYSDNYVIDQDLLIKKIESALMKKYLKILGWIIALASFVLSFIYMIWLYFQ